MKGSFPRIFISLISLRQPCVMDVIPSEVEVEEERRGKLERMRKTKREQERMRKDEKTRNKEK